MVLMSVYFNSLPALQAPSQVTGVSLSKAVRNKRPTLLVNWTTPQSDVTISEYHVQFRRNTTTTWGTQSAATPPATSTLLPELDAGTLYDVHVRAVSAAGNGEWSEVQTGRTFSGEFKIKRMIYCYQLHLHFYVLKLLSHSVNVNCCAVHTAHALYTGLLTWQ